MTISKTLFFTGLIIFVIGIVLLFALPATVTWKPKSEVLADKKTLAVSAGWNSKSDNLIDKILTVSKWSTYDYWFGFRPFIFEEAKDFVINGTAVEQSVPQRKFNFYIFDDINFDLWKAGKTYTSYHEAKEKTSVTFRFSIATEEAIPSTFYFVVEEISELSKPTVRVTATTSWAEKASLYECSEYFTSLKFTFEEAKDFVLRGTATEVGNNKFNFYILDTTNYLNWIGSKPYMSYYEIKNVPVASFSIPLTKTQATSIFYFVAENPLLDTNETITVSATLEWNEKATIAATIGGIVLGGFISFVGFIIMVIAGIAHYIFKPKV